MRKTPATIIACPACKVKNRIIQFETGKIPLCAKCGIRLVSENENETQVWFGKSLKNMSDIPDPRYFGKS